MAILERLAVRPMCAPARHVQASTVHALQPVLQHRTVLLIENVGAYFNGRIGPNPDQVPIERSPCHSVPCCSNFHGNRP